MGDVTGSGPRTGPFLGPIGPHLRGDEAKRAISSQLRAFGINTGHRYDMPGRQEFIERLMTELFREPEHPSPFHERTGIVIAGVEITSPEAIKKYTRMNLERRIPAVDSLKTCEEFWYLNVKCSDCACHSVYEIYDMNGAPLPEGGYAWVC